MDVEFPPKNYMEAVVNQHGKYIPRLYLQERSGGVIGANMMIGHNVIFDIENHRVGFARSDCGVIGSDMHDKVSRPFKIKRRLHDMVRTDGAVGDMEGTILLGRDGVVSHAGDSTRLLHITSSSAHQCPMVPLGPCNALCGR